jgi:Uma2 family endonuclease
MRTAETKTRYTPEDLLHMPDGDRYELINGELVERDRSFWSSYVAGVSYWLLGAFCQSNPLGWVVPEGTSYKCFANEPGKVRKPDTSFIARERLSLAQAFAEGHLRLAPDLAVEVIAPNDLYYQVDDKVQEWLAAGVRLVWVVNPRTHRVRVFRADGTETALTANDELTGEDVLPGFRCRVAELFQPPPGVSTAP